MVLWEESLLSPFLTGKSFSSNLTERNFEFGFVIPGPCKTLLSVIEAAPKSQMLPARILK